MTELAYATMALPAERLPEKAVERPSLGFMRAHEIAHSLPEDLGRSGKGSSHSGSFPIWLRMEVELKVKMGWHVDTAYQPFLQEARDRVLRLSEEAQVDLLAEQAESLLGKMYRGESCSYEVSITEDGEVAIEVSRGDAAVSIQLHPAGSAWCRAVSRHDMRQAWYSRGECVNGVFLEDTLDRFLGGFPPPHSVRLPGFQKLAQLS